jgi:GMP synthase (glutamine-hydrolysing)
MDAPVLVVDNLSPFTPEITACLERLAVPCVYRKFSDVAPADLAGCSRVILSGRRRNDPAINATNSKIIKSCHDRGVPLLGICYGSEIIALTMGGTLRRMPSHVHGPAKVVPLGPNPLTGAKKGIEVYESHGYCVARLPEGFERLAGSAYCEIEMFAHKTKKIYGTQFHPEKSGPDGRDLLANFVRL